VTSGFISVIMLNCMEMNYCRSNQNTLYVLRVSVLTNSSAIVSKATTTSKYRFFCSYAEETEVCRT